MAGYSKQFLIDAYMSRYIACPLIAIEDLEKLELLADKFYDEVGRDKFRIYASLDADAIRLYKSQI